MGPVGPRAPAAEGGGGPVVRPVEILKLTHAHGECDSVI